MYNSHELVTLDSNTTLTVNITDITPANTSYLLVQAHSQSSYILLSLQKLVQQDLLIISYNLVPVLVSSFSLAFPDFLLVCIDYVNMLHEVLFVQLEFFFCKLYIMCISM